MLWDCMLRVCWAVNGVDCHGCVLIGIMFSIKLGLRVSLVRTPCSMDGCALITYEWLRSLLFKVAVVLCSLGLVMLALMWGVNGVSGCCVYWWAPLLSLVAMDSTYI